MLEHHGWQHPNFL